MSKRLLYVLELFPPLQEHNWNECAQARAPANDQRSTVPASTPLLQMPCADLGYWMGKFVMEVRMKDGSE